MANPRRCGGALTLIRIVIDVYHMTSPRNLTALRMVIAPRTRISEGPCRKKYRRYGVRKYVTTYIRDPSLCKGVSDERALHARKLVPEQLQVIQFAYWW